MVLAFAPPQTPPAAIPEQGRFACLVPSTFKPYVDRFNREDVAEGLPERTSIPDSRAWDFLEREIPFFECPDKQFEETYYYRWWCYRKHLKETPAGWVVTEFLPDVPWAGSYNTISCAAGHHLYEGRWLRDPLYMEDYARFWFRSEARPRLYSFWAADAIRALTLVNGDRALGTVLLDRLVENYRRWEADHRDSNGLFFQIDDRDGMEFSLGGSGFRPTINAYMFGDATAIATIAEGAGRVDLAKEFRKKAKRLKALVQEKLWNPEDGFFETLPRGADATVGVREQVGFVPWYFNLPDSKYASAWRQLFETQGFAAPFGPTTAERRAKGFMKAEPHDCLWNGPSWPYATTQTLVAMANLLQSGTRETAVSPTRYFDALRSYARSQQKDGHPWVAEDLDPDTGQWIVDLPRSAGYNHSGFADLVVTGLAGLRPSSGGRVVVNPLLPKGAWDWFCLDGVPYHGHRLTILWDREGRRYHRGAGLTLLIDGKVAKRRKDVGKLTADLPLRYAESTLRSVNYP